MSFILSNLFDEKDKQKIMDDIVEMRSQMINDEEEELNNHPTDAHPSLADGQGGIR